MALVSGVHCRFTLSLMLKNLYKNGAIKCYYFIRYRIVNIHSTLHNAIQRILYRENYRCISYVTE